MIGYKLKCQKNQKSTVNKNNIKRIIDDEIKEVKDDKYRRLYSLCLHLLELLFPLSIKS